MNVKLKRESRLLIMAITSVALFVHIVVICAASTREVVANKFNLSKIVYIMI